jgi:uncharacterized protein (TIGR00369 family)
MSAMDFAMADQPDPGWGAARSKTVTWQAPGPLAAAAGEMAGREFLQAMIDGRLPHPPMARLIGTELTSVADGEAVFRCRPDESSYNPIGMVHGGLLCTLLDSAAGCAVHTLLPAHASYSSIEIKVSFLRTLRAGAGCIEVRGLALRVGKRVAFAEARATDERGELLGQATSSLVVSRP